MTNIRKKFIDKVKIYLRNKSYNFFLTQRKF